LISKQDISKLINEIEKTDAKLVKKMLMETKRNVRTSITDPIRIDTIEIGKS
jgi:lipid II:glycine glycyltransferase (peptidoglycan interpeptide bridge formation enzyme)